MKKNAIFALLGILALVLFTSLISAHRIYADDKNGNDNQMMNGGEGEGVGQMMKQAHGENESENESQKTQESVSIEQNGNFRVTGVKVNSVDTASVAVNISFYGFNRTISLNGAAIAGNKQTIAIGDIQAGDVLSANGNWNESTHALTVSSVNDVSYSARNVSNIQGQINQLLQLVQQLQAQLQSMQQGH